MASFSQMYAPISSSSSAFLGQNSSTNSRWLKVVITSRSCKIVRCIVTPEKTAYKTTVSHNANLAKLQAGYLFPERANALSTLEGYSGYGAEQGDKDRRAAYMWGPRTV
ncbi:LL-diaminopimelate aminotransferase, chloroplastic [Cinnamomum micranthum f. kanehirae]|uniref:LL-diaminopimelate aminotransferase, chloroplastic n=1 Tax=Cinnamomum micranthum f. kanehirae TaxID=337451 RepID=A0A443PR69_9MAGN|nr:LL-diaminopimelate aminotransferase, chloroplastic [Cinnamomum micranthum f. kanehirae]